MKLSSKERKKLESLAHDIDPVVQIGKNGITDHLIKTVDENLEARELIKVKILDNSTVEKEEAADEIVERTGCTLVRIIGRTLMLYRPSKKKKKNRIELSGPEED